MSPPTNSRSRFVRPTTPRPLELTPRDRAVLVSVFRHRFLSAEHLRRLHFAAASLNATQRRLRRLWENRLLDRYWRPLPWHDDHHPGKRPLYVLGPAGVDVVAGDLALPVQVVRRGIPSTTAYHARLEHELVTADFLTSLIAALRGRTEAVLVSTEPEPVLWRKLRQRGSPAGPRRPFLVSDSAVTFSDRDGGNRRTFHLEVVRADVRSGNKGIATKMALYLRLLRSGYFAETFGHERLRAVLFLTTSPDRAENLRQLAMKLEHGRQLFWFGAYEQWDRGGTPESSLTPEDALEAMWTDAAGERQSLLA